MASCYICLETGEEELERACDFCRGGNVVHFSCLHEYFKQTNQEANSSDQHYMEYNSMLNGSDQQA